MPFRYEHLQNTLTGYNQTGVPLVEYNGTAYLPAGISDDTGIYYFVPKIANFFGLSLEHAISLFFTGMLVISLSVALFSFMNLLKKKSHKAIAVLFLCILTVYLVLRGDIYILSALAPLLVIPLIYYLRTKRIKLVYHIIFYLFLGLLISLSNFIRSNSGTAVIIFIITFLIFDYFHEKKKILLYIVVLFAGIVIGSTGIKTILNERDSFLSRSQTGQTHLIEGHVFWHSVYLGLGYLTNNYGICYRDEFAYEKAKSINPGIILHSNEYENLMKKEVFDLVKTDPWFIIKTMASKFGVVFLYLMLFSNIGMYFIIRSIKNYRLIVPVGLALLFNFSFPILVMPFPGYMIGVVGMVIILSILSLEKVSPLQNEQESFKLFFEKNHKGKN